MAALPSLARLDPRAVAPTETWPMNWPWRRETAETIRDEMVALLRSKPSADVARLYQFVRHVETTTKIKGYWHTLSKLLEVMAAQGYKEGDIEALNKMAKRMQTLLTDRLPNAKVDSELVAYTIRMKMENLQTELSKDAVGPQMFQPSSQSDEDITLLKWRIVALFYVLVALQDDAYPEVNLRQASYRPRNNI